MVGDPEVADGIEGVGKDDPLRKTLTCDSLIGTYVCCYPVAHSHLEDWPVLLRPSLSYLCMARAELKQAAEYRQTRYFRKTLDMRCVRPIHKPVQEYANDYCASDVDGNRHCCKAAVL